MFQALIIQVESMEARTARSRGKEFDEVPPADYIHITEVQAVLSEIRRQVDQAFGPDSFQKGLLETTLVPEDLKDNEDIQEWSWRRWHHVWARLATLLKTFDQQLAASKGEAELKQPQTEKLTILFLAANPIETDALRLDEEIRAIDHAVREAEFRDFFKVESQWAVRVEEIPRALMRFKPDIVHFSGHGTRSSEIVLEGPNGVAQAVPAQGLADLFGILRDDIRCVVLNACYSDVQAQGIAEHIDFVVGMTRSVSDAAAIAFASAFYQGLAYDRTVQEAFDLGRTQITLRGLSGGDIAHLLAPRADAGQVRFATAGRI